MAYHLGSLLFLLYNITNVMSVKDKQIAVEETSKTSSKQSIEKIFAFINENISTIKNIEQVAKFIHISESYLSTIFKQETGLSIMQYIISIRINLSAKELIYTDKSISEIASDCGFESPNYFCNTFKKMIGCSPSQYRKSNKQYSQ